MFDFPKNQYFTETFERRLLIVGVGNVLKSDDAFGVEVVKEMIQIGKNYSGVKILETGIGGINFIQEMMLDYKGLMIIDSYQKGGLPGTLYLLEPTVNELSHDIHELRDYYADTHYAKPERALQFLKAIGQLPSYVRIVGCEPQNVEEMNIGMSLSVKNAIPKAIKLIDETICEFSLQNDYIELNNTKEMLS